MSGEASGARAVPILLALAGAAAAARWFALIVWACRDIASRSRSAVAQICSTLVVVLGFAPGALLYLILRPRAPHRLRLRRGRWAGGVNRALDTVPPEVAPHPAGDDVTPPSRDPAPRLPGP